jgi:NADH dehydrogenase [ubiquinone] 1 alpha subcomplex assembly factor 5
MSLDSHPPEIFDRQRRRALRERAGSRAADAFLWGYVADDLAERLAVVTRKFERVLMIGPIAHWQDKILAQVNAKVLHAPLGGSEAIDGGTTPVEEDRLPFDPASFDLVIAAGTLDSVNDLPGALIQIRRILRPDGLFLGHMFGAGTLATLKSMMLAAEQDIAAPHIHPQIDLRSAADLLARAGFALPVADQDVMTVRYAEWRSIVSDLRDAGIGNALAGPRRYLGKRFTRRLDTGWASRADEQGKAEEYFTHLFLSGWAPSSEQPQPARRGSGQLSLAAILPSSIKR